LAVTVALAAGYVAIRYSNPFLPAARLVVAQAGSKDLVFLYTADRRAALAFEGMNVLLVLDDASPLDDLARELLGFDHLWLVGHPGVPLPIPSSLVVERVWRTGHDVEVARVRVPASLPQRTSLVDRLSSARVDRMPVVDGRPGARVRCPPPPDRDSGAAEHRCPGEEWRTVSVTSLPVGGRRERCVFAHPVLRERLELSFDSLPDAGRLVGWVAIADTGHDPSRPAAPVDLVVLWNGQMAGRVRAADRLGRQAVRMSLPPDGPRTVGTLTLQVTSEDQDRRHFCFALWVESEPLLSRTSRERGRQ
jgi:hypothetical protein